MEMDISTPSVKRGATYRMRLKRAINEARCDANIKVACPVYNCKSQLQIGI